ncbi:MAG: hypothetical protein KGR26_11095 [Cyanobacteria bacterium REEB65]|nr:hypothetical protein [Cyanobacteria bacterium REEB65]
MPANPRESLFKEIQAGFFGDYLVTQGLVSEGQLKEALDQQWSKTPQFRIGEILVRLGYLDGDALVRALADYKVQLRLGEILVFTGEIRFMQLLDALNEQRRRHQTLGNVLVELGYCSAARVTEALEIQRTLFADEFPAGH